MDLQPLTLIVICRDESFLDIYSKISVILGLTTEFYIATSINKHLYRKIIWNNVSLDPNIFIKEILIDLRRNNCDFIFRTDQNSNIEHLGLHANLKNLSWRKI